jgi:hypothetical protein
MQNLNYPPCCIDIPRKETTLSDTMTTETSTESSTETISSSDVLTHAELERKLYFDATRVSNAADDLSKAEKAYLSNTHRSRFLSDDSHALSLRDELPALEDAEREAFAVARAARDAAIAIRSQLASTEIPTLTRADMEAAGHIQGLIETDAARMALRQLIVEVKAAIASGEKARMYVWHRALGARLGSPSVLDRLDSDATAQLSTARRQIAEKLRDRSGSATRDRANLLLDKSFALESHASRRSREVAQAKQSQAEGRVPFPPV